MALRYMREVENSRLGEEERGFWVVSTVFKAFIHIAGFFLFNEASLGFANG